MAQEKEGFKNITFEQQEEDERNEKLEQEEVLVCMKGGPNFTACQ
jgi:hypothetical protein